MRDFPNPAGDPSRSANEVWSIVQNYEPGNSGLYQLIHMYIGEGNEKKWMDLANSRELSVGCSKWHAADKTTGPNLYDKTPQVFPKNTNGREIQQCVRRPDETVFFITLVIQKRHSYSCQVLRMPKKRKETPFPFNTTF